MSSSKPVPSLAWFCLRAQPKHEHIAAQHLKKLPGVEVFCPRVRFQRATRRGKVWFTEAMFPNYAKEYHEEHHERVDTAQHSHQSENQSH